MRAKARWKSVAEFVFGGVASVALVMAILERVNSPIDLAGAVVVLVRFVGLLYFVGVAERAWSEI